MMMIDLIDYRFFVLTDSDMIHHNVTPQERVNSTSQLGFGIYLWG